MTVRDYITEKANKLNLALTAADWSDIGKAVSPDAEDTEDNVRKAYVVLVERVLPFYVHQVESVSENGFSFSYTKNGLMTFYRWLCRETGMEDVLSERSSIGDISDMY
ncbi:MAG: hypothetical protein LBB90_10425 [Tannerella sp.]|jgi:hypothetical protein|nr:hypothetical protein [Tannerella sp.]